MGNLKTIRRYGWPWLTSLKGNRLVSPDGTGNRPLQEVAISPYGTQVHLEGYGFILVFRMDAPDGDTEYWATSQLDLTAPQRAEWEGQIWTIETYHRDLKQYCGVERGQARSTRAQRNPIGWAIRAFVRLEYHRIRTGTT